MAASKARDGKKMIAGHFDPGVSMRLRQLALEEGSSVQALLEEAIADLLVKRASQSGRDASSVEIPPDVRQRMGRVNRTCDQLMELLAQVQEEVRKTTMEVY